ncbi:proline-rich protein 3 isoform X2 [Choloepus didactylus]|uniref:proline-rich protein 3 isoform X2 n=1 Tax=Choloepus didactylus TaxID=27675 RepID=UPI00189E5737|nr:proline-rich protein 3 isoform X2 [Choloepus didactylus]
MGGSLPENGAAAKAPGSLPEVKWREPHPRCPPTPRKRKQNASVPLPHCPPNPAAAIAATTMPKRKKQNHQQPQPPQTPLPEREETGDEEDGSPIALHRGPPGSRAPMIPPLLSLPPPPRGHGGPSRGGFHKEQRNPRRLKSWSLIKNTCPPKDGPQVIEDKSDRPVCRHFAKKGHCRYEDFCAFYHPGINGPPL